MIQRAAEDLSALYEADETAWLDIMAELIRKGRLERLDYAHLAEYLEDMARRDRREVKSRLTDLIAHLLRWQRQARKRTRSWRGKIIAKRFEVREDVRGGVLRRHAEAVLQEAYTHAVEQVAVETGLRPADFPATCPYTLDQLHSANF
jgi:hypothetical protein